MACLLAGLSGGTSLGNHPNRTSLPTVDKRQSFSSPSPSSKEGTNWTGPYPPCGNNSELLKHGPMHVGVRIAVANPRLAAEIRRALDFWSGVLAMTWFWHLNRYGPESSRIGSSANVAISQPFEYAIIFSDLARRASW